MKFTTPFSIRNGVFHDRFFNRLELISADYQISSGKNIDTDFHSFFRDGVKMLRISIDDNALSDPDGKIIAGAALRAFDQAVEKAFECGIYLTLIPITTGKLTGQKNYGPDAITAQQNYLSDLFIHKNSFSGKRLYEYENLAALEILFDLDAFKENEFDLYCGRVLMEPYIDHYFSSRVLKIYSLERGMPDNTQAAAMNRHSIKSVDANAFRQKSSNKLDFESFMPGIPESVISSWIKGSGQSGWSPVAVGDATSIDEHPHQNGGAEGWLSFASNISVDLRLSFPYTVKTAKFRPSLEKEVKVKIEGSIVEMTLSEPCYGALEINYDNDDKIASSALCSEES